METNPIPFIEIMITFLEKLKRENLSYDNAIEELRKTIKIIENHTNHDINKEISKGENKQNVAEDRKGDIT